MNITPYKYGRQLLGTQVRAVYPQQSLEAQTQGSDLCRAVAKGQGLFQMLEKNVEKKGLQRGEMRAVETTSDTTAPLYCS